LTDGLAIVFTLLKRPETLGHRMTEAKDSRVYPGEVAQSGKRAGSRVSTDPQLRLGSFGYLAH